MRRGYITLVLWLAWGVGAQAQLPGVRLVERDGLRPELCAALRIQLSGAADVSCEPGPAEATLPERIQDTAMRVRSRGERLGVFLERDPDPGLVRMYLVGSQPDQAVLAVEKIEDRPDHDVDRSLALKVSASLELVGRVEAQIAATSKQAEPAMPMAAALAAPAESTQPPSLSPIPARSWAFLAEFGGGVRIDPQAHGVVGATLGVSRVAPKWRVDLGLGFEISTRYSIVEGLAEVQAWERGPFLSARALRRLRRFEWGGELQLGCSFLAAEGIAADGSHGEKLLAIPGMGIGLDVRVRLFSSAYLRLSPRLDIPFIDQSLRVDQVTVVDYPPVGATVPLSLLFYLPLTPGKT